MWTREDWFHVTEIAILLFGVAAPITYGVIRLVAMLKDFPPHKHINGKILYPKGYEPGQVETLRLS